VLDAVQRSRLNKLAAQVSVKEVLGRLNGLRDYVSNVTVHLSNIEQLHRVSSNLSRHRLSF
jgi:hypothetical protein